jgi:CxxC-x17-CxxC domain-containing protein
MLLGSLLITKLQLAAMSRVDVPEEQRQDFFLYVDEFQNFATESFATILSEARKYRLDLILGHQYINQLTEEVRDAVFGNVGTLICFRIGAEDAEFLEKEFSPDFTASDLVNLGKYNVYLKLMINGLAGRPFSAQTLPPILKQEKSSREKIIKVSRERYATPKQAVEEKIARWAEVTEKSVASTPVFREPVLYDAQCAACQKWTKVVFKPDGKRPVYCKTCLKKTERSQETKVDKEKPPSPPPTSLPEALAKPLVSFSPAKREEPRLDRLKETIKEALDEKNQSPPDTKPPLP